MTFSASTTTIIFTVGAALLALWTIARFPNVGPRGVVRSFVHLVIAFVLAALVPGGIELANRLVGDNAILAATLLVVLPALMYMFVATLWLLRALQELTGLRGS